MHVVTLLTNPETPVLERVTVESLRNAWGGGEARWLDPGVAAEFDLGEVPENRWEVWESLQALQVDMVLQRAEGRKKRLLIADMDSTMIRQECIDELADEAGVGADGQHLEGDAQRRAEEGAVVPAHRRHLEPLLGPRRLDAGKRLQPGHRGVQCGIGPGAVGMAGAHESAHKGGLRETIAGIARIGGKAIDRLGRHRDRPSAQDAGGGLRDRVGAISKDFGPERLVRLTVGHAAL